MTRQQWISLAVVLLVAAGATAWAISRSSDSTSNGSSSASRQPTGATPDDAALNKTCAVSDIEPPNVNGPVRDPFFAQEVWVSYLEDDVKHLPNRYPRSRNEALARVRNLCKRVYRGEDIGSVAREASNGVGARALGFTFAPLDPKSITRRDRVYIATPVWGMTPVIEWNGGFGFAKRIDRKRGFELLALQRREARRRAKVRVITFAYRGSWPAQEKKRHITRDVARSTAQGVLNKILKEEAEFDEMARQYCFDAATRARGGVLEVRHPKTRERTEWIHWGTRDIGSDLLKWILDERTPVGHVHPELLDFKRGWMIIEVLARE